jgi:hypothetical protein
MEYLQKVGSAAQQTPGIATHARRNIPIKVRNTGVTRKLQNNSNLTYAGIALDATLLASQKRGCHCDTDSDTRWIRRTKYASRRPNCTEGSDMANLAACFVAAGVPSLPLSLQRHAAPVR